MLRATKLPLALPAVALGALLLAGCGDDGDDDVAEPATETTAAAGEAAGDAVFIAGFAFSPGALTVPSGTTVTWTNEDSATHTVTADDGAGSFDSDGLGEGATFEHTFDEAGTFAYHCEIHPTMTGEVVVDG